MVTTIDNWQDIAPRRRGIGPVAHPDDDDYEMKILPANDAWGKCGIELSGSVRNVDFGSREKDCS